MVKYYLIVDNSGFGFTYVIEVDKSDKSDSISKCTELDPGIHGPFIKSICERELHFTDKKFTGIMFGGNYCGWTISKNEYNTILELIELYPKYLKYIKLL